MDTLYQIRYARPWAYSENKLQTWVISWLVTFHFLSRRFEGFHSPVSLYWKGNCNSAVFNIEVLITDCEPRVLQAVLVHTRSFCPSVSNCKNDVNLVSTFCFSSETEFWPSDFGWMAGNSVVMTSLHRQTLPQSRQCHALCTHLLKTRPICLSLGQRVNHVGI